MTNSPLTCGHVAFFATPPLAAFAVDHQREYSGGDEEDNAEHQYDARVLACPVAAFGNGV